MSKRKRSKKTALIREEEELSRFKSLLSSARLYTRFNGLTDAQTQKLQSLAEELYELYKNRVKSKHFTKEAYIFEQQATTELYKAAAQLINHRWAVAGYYPFDVYNPHRTINAPHYEDRIIEQYLVEKAIKPVLGPQLYKYSMACQEGKGPLLAQDYVEYALSELWSMYGTEFYVFQFDIHEFFNCISHDAALSLFQEIGEEWFWIYKNVVVSFYIEDGYAALRHPENPKGYGFPKGNLPSQWTGIMVLNELVYEISEDPDCFFTTLYMDDGLAFFPKKKDAKACRKMTEEYLDVSELALELHPKKSRYYKVTCGITFCGRRYTLDKDTGKVTVRIKNGRKKCMERSRKNIYELVAQGKMDALTAARKKEGQDAYLDTGMESGHLKRYMERRYPLPKVAASRKAKKRYEKQQYKPSRYQVEKARLECKAQKAWPPIGTFGFPKSDARTYYLSTRLVDVLLLPIDKDGHVWLVHIPAKLGRLLGRRISERKTTFRAFREGYVTIFVEDRFYETYRTDACVLGEVMGYTVWELPDGTINCGFPYDKLSDVRERLREKNVSYIVRKGRRIFDWFNVKHDNQYYRYGKYAIADRYGRKEAGSSDVLNRYSAGMPLIGTVPDVKRSAHPVIMSNSTITKLMRFHGRKFRLFYFGSDEELYFPDGFMLRNCHSF